ncbi:MAG TPA: cytochrome c [Pseudolabrys sp.]|nr:cytochrome c [Pseudolabrys sp.]
MIWRGVAGFIVVLALAFGAFYAWQWRDEIAPVKPPVASSFDPAIVAKGARLAAVGDCAVCHTKAGGKPFAGGFPVQSPFGIIYGSNITPDPQTGIGSWSEEAFRRALREGVTRKGNHLYPAFPYDHFTRVTDDDISALYAYLMTREPVQQRNLPPDLPFPLNIRLSAAAWKLLFLSTGQYQPDRTQSAQWNRGAYLTAGLGHCGACHSPRNSLGAEDNTKAYAGGKGEGWTAPALNSASPAPVPWTADQLYAYLRHGFADEHGHVAGPMQPVVQELARASESDVRAIAVYIASLPGAQNAAQLQQRTKAALQFAQNRNPTVVRRISTTGVAAAPEAQQMHGSADGAAIFAGACASCHHSGGELPISRPIELGLSTPVNEQDPTDFIRIVLDGIHPAPQRHGPIMPGFAGALTDAQIIALAAYVRAQFSRAGPWTHVAETLKAAHKNPEPKSGMP